MKHSHLIKDTTKEDREELVKNALAILLLDASEPTQETMELVKSYINGEMELEEIKNSIIKRYQKR